MPKIYISPSNQTKNFCKYGDTECQHCNDFADYLCEYLTANGIEYKRAGVLETLESRVKASNSYKPDIHYCIHTNAGGGARSVLMGYSVTDKKWLKIADCIKAERSKLYKSEIRYTKKTGFYEIKNTTAKCVYDEVLFHDNEREAQFFHENIKEMAKGTAKAFCNYFNISFIDIDADASEQAKKELEALKKRVHSANSVLKQIKDLAEPV